MAPFIKEKRLVVGSIFILIGVLLLADKFGFWFLPGWIFSWQMILIVIGTLVILTGDNPTPGVIMLCVGAFFLLNHYFYPVFFQVVRFWPLVFIIIGVFILLSLTRRRDRKQHRRFGCGETATVSGEDFLDEVAVFGGGHRKITSQNFKGGKLTAIFGGSEIDLTLANLAEGVNVLDVTAIFGGWELRVPANWNVEIRITPVFGGFSDKRYINSSDPVDNTRKLVITGTTIFGGGELKNYSKR